MSTSKLPAKVKEKLAKKYKTLSKGKVFLLKPIVVSKVKVRIYWEEMDESTWAYENEDTMHDDMHNQLTTQIEALQKEHDLKIQKLFEEFHNACVKHKLDGETEWDLFQEECLG